MTERRLGSTGYLKGALGGARIHYDAKYIDLGSTYSKPGTGIPRQPSSRISTDKYVSSTRDRSIGGDTKTNMGRDPIASSGSGYQSGKHSIHYNAAANKSRITRTLLNYEVSKMKTELPTHFETLWKERRKDTERSRAPTVYDSKELVKETEVKQNEESEVKKEKSQVPIYGNVGSYTRAEKTADKNAGSFKALRQQFQPMNSTPYLEMTLSKADNQIDLKQRVNPVLAKADLSRSIEEIAVKQHTKRQSVSDLMEIMRKTNFNETLVRELVEKLVHYKTSYEGVKATCSRLVSKKPLLGNETGEPEPKIPTPMVKLDINPELSKYLEPRLVTKLSKEIKPQLDISPPPKMIGNFKEQFGASSVKSEHRGNNSRDQSSDTVKAGEGDLIKKLTRSFVEDDDKKTKVRSREDILLADIGTPKR